MLPHKKIRILVVDDELSIRESLSGWLKQGGYQVDTAADGLTALARSKENYYDIMLIDVKMPEMDGLSLLRKLKETESETAMLMMTAYGDIHDAVEAIKLGAYDYLLKPFELEELNFTLEKLVQMQNLAMENLILKERLASITRFENLVGQSPAMVKLFETIVDVAQERRHRFDHRGNRHRQGIGGPGHPCAEPQVLCPLYCHQLRGLHRKSPGERALRTRERSLHRRQVHQERPAGNGQCRDPLPG